MFKRILTLMVIAVLAVALIPTMASATETMYVYTKNGRNLNVRYDPSSDGEIFITVPYGERLTVLYHLGNGWSAISWDGNVYYVQTRFLVYEKPGKKPTPQPTSKPGKVGDSSTTVAELNTIFKTYKPVATPFSITVRPTRASGWVNLRFVYQFIQMPVWIRMNHSAVHGQPPHRGEQHSSHIPVTAALHDTHILVTVNQAQYIV